MLGIPAGFLREIDVFALTTATDRYVKEKICLQFHAAFNLLFFCVEGFVRVGAGLALLGFVDLLGARDLGVLAEATLLNPLGHTQLLPVPVLVLRSRHPSLQSFLVELADVGRFAPHAKKSSLLQAMLGRAVLVNPENQGFRYASHLPDGQVIKLLLPVSERLDGRLKLSVGRLTEALSGMS